MKTEIYTKIAPTLGFYKMVYERVFKWLIWKLQINNFDNLFDFNILQKITK